MVQLSVVVITYNEAAHIGRCLASVKDLADELLVVDSFSTDKTEMICRKMGARFVKHPFSGHIQQKNLALELASYEYVLSLDADEALDEAAQASIMALKSQWQADGYCFRRKTFYAGQWIRYGGWYPDRKLRLIDRRKGHWTGLNPHDRLELHSPGPCPELAGHILHYTCENISQHVEQVQRFSSIASQARFEAGQKASLLRLLFSPWFKFVKMYLLKRGFLDGYYGFVIAVISAYSTFLRYAKLKEKWANKFPSSSP